MDYVFSYKNKVIPVEAKAGLVVHAQSLKVFCEKYTPDIAIRTSLKGFRVDAKIMNLPLYEIRNLKNILERLQEDV